MKRLHAAFKGVEILIHLPQHNEEVEQEGVLGGKAEEETTFKGQ